MTGYGCCACSGRKDDGCARLGWLPSSSPLPFPLWLPSEEVSRGLGITSRPGGEGVTCAISFDRGDGHAQLLCVGRAGALFLRSRCLRFWNQIWTERGLMLS
eukprot:scaffold47263_cov63-Phaeocystis_antarctica.AAC.1